MGKKPLVKEKENYIIVGGFLLDFLQVKFSLWCLPPVPNGFNSLGNCKGSFYIRSIFINLIAVSISKKDVLQRV